MKTMKRLLKLNNFFFLLLFVSVNIFAETKWEVAVVFLDNSSDVAENIKELQTIQKNPNLSISIFKDHIDKLSDFLEHAYKKSNTLKSLIIYSHGKGPQGLKNIDTKELKEIISAHTPHLDILWFDACFMANMEFLYELKSLSNFTIASEDAEFAAGMPFQTLELLPSTNTSAEAALMLGKTFIESYSYLKAGAQRNYVSESSATLSIFENSKWDLLSSNLKLISEKIRKLSFNTQMLKKYYSMENTELVDLGHLLITLRAANKEPLFDKLLTSTIRLLNIQSVKKLRSNPRVKIVNPEHNSLMVFGFNNWSQGTQVDFSANEVFNQVLSHDSFILGPHKANWPYKKMTAKTITITPFAPGINAFNYYFLNSDATKLLTEAKAIYRTSDIVEVERENSSSPLLYTAYTQEVGKQAERYTGLSITLPGTIPSLDYFELDFNLFASWLSL